MKLSIVILLVITSFACRSRGKKNDSKPENNPEPTVTTVTGIDGQVDSKNDPNNPGNTGGGTDPENPEIVGNNDKPAADEQGICTPDLVRDYPQTLNSFAAELRLEIEQTGQYDEECKEILTYQHQAKIVLTQYVTNFTCQHQEEQVAETIEYSARDLETALDKLSQFLAAVRLAVNPNYCQ